MGINNYLYESSVNTATEGVMAIFGVVVAVITFIIAIAMIVFTIIGMWKVFEKNGMPGWYAVIPGFNAWKFLELNKIPGWTMFLPYANIAYMALASYRIAIKMGKDIVFAIINVFYPFVGLMILGFSNAQPVPEKKEK